MDGCLTIQRDGEVSIIISSTPEEGNAAPVEFKACRGILSPGRCEGMMEVPVTRCQVSALSIQMTR